MIVFPGVTSDIIRGASLTKEASLLGEEREVQAHRPVRIDGVLVLKKEDSKCQIYPFGEVGLSQRESDEDDDDDDRSSDREDGPLEEQIERLQERVESAQSEQKNLFLVIFQRFIMLLTEHLVRCETGGIDVFTPWYKSCIERLQQIFLQGEYMLIDISGAHQQSFKLGSKGEGDNIRLACNMLWDDVPRLEGRGAGEDPQPTAQRCAGRTTARLKPRGDEPGAPSATGTNRVTLGRYIKGIPDTPASKSASSGAQLKCLYANARSMGNKQEELEMCVCLQGYDLIGIRETWWDSSYDWSVGMEGYRLFRKDRQGRRGGGVTLYVNDQLECMELHLGMEEELTESLWVRIKGSTGAGDIIVGVCYRPPDQGD
ncbi:hypothetical protein GRJ2_003502700 [Grus japonensis]|uniref:MIF4G-like type 2 domain-containing protein n=1 Tax=Grus japonensis TaxID=30415 RepID=A0ABC9YL20_GRUJA